MSDLNFAGPLLNARKMLNAAQEAAERGTIAMAEQYAHQAVHEAQFFLEALQRLPGGSGAGPCQARYKIPEGWLGCVLTAGHEGGHMDASGAWDR